MLTNKMMVIVCSLWSALLYYCTPSVSGVETTNGFATVVATSTTIEGTAPPLSQVYMCDTGYIPFIDSGIGFVTSADHDGNFKFARRSGSYHVSIISPQGATADIVINATAKNATAFQNSLEHPGSISGSVMYTLADTLLAYLAGTSHYQLIADGQAFDFTSVPEGVYRLKIIRLSQSPITVLHEENVSVHPGENTAVGSITVD